LPAWRKEVTKNANSWHIVLKCRVATTHDEFCRRVWTVVLGWDLSADGSVFDGFQKMQYLQAESQMKKCLTLLIVLILTACGTTEVIKRADSNYSVSAQFGALNGSWNRATEEAVAKAQQFCNAMGQKYIFLNEKRDGVPGWSPQVSKITFQCGQDTNALIKAEQQVCAKEM